MPTILALSLFPSTDWWATALAVGGAGLYTGILREGHYNRYRLATANGILTCSVPLQGGRRQQCPLREILIDYTHDWQRQHWGALYSAYGRSPFFRHFAPGLQALIETRHEQLETLNRAALDWVCRELRLPLTFSEVADDALPQKIPLRTPEYHQVFAARHGFQAGLSVLDLMMNEGAATLGILKQ